LLYQPGTHGGTMTAGRLPISGTTSSVPGSYPATLRHQECGLEAKLGSICSDLVLINFIH
jgi:hypothetical protein